MEMFKALVGQRSYRCFYTPKDGLGHLTPSDTGAQPFVQLKAPNAEAAFVSAHHVTGCPVSDVERIEHAA
jgi:hypothetical protein